MMPARKTGSAPPEEGFTLMELIIAITLTAMIAVALWAVFSTSIRSWGAGTATIDANQVLRSVLDMTRRQIASAYPLARNEAGTFNWPPSLMFQGNDRSLRFVSLNSRHFFESPGLTLVAYEAVPNAEGALSLQTAERQYTGEADGLENIQEASESLLLFDELDSCIFEYYDPGEEGEGEAKWVPEWDGSVAGRLPAAVRLTMVSRSVRGSGFERQIVIPLHARTLVTEQNPLDRGNETFRRRQRPGGRSGRRFQRERITP